MPHLPHLPRRLVQLYAGLVLFAFGEVLILRAALGVIPWDVLHQGLVNHFGLTIGQWSIIVGAVVLLGWIPLRERPGLGTVSNVLVIGFFVDVFLGVVAAPEAMWMRLAFLSIGIVLNGVATAAYIGALLGPGPRDGLMTGLVRRTGGSVRVIRTAIEVAVVMVGWLLGGNLGLGTVAFALLIGPVVHVALPRLTAPGVLPPGIDSPRPSGGGRAGVTGQTGRVKAEAIDLRPIDLLDPGQDADARAWIGVHHAARRQAMREDGGAWTLAELRALHRAGQKRRVVRGAWVHGALVGALEVVMPQLDNQRLATMWLSVAPGSRRQGVGTALHAEAERIAREHGRNLLHTTTVWRVDGADESEEFARRQGFEVGMTDLRSFVDLRHPGRLRDFVRGGGPDEYELESFVDDMPEEWLEDRALLQQRMLTDMPLGNLMLDEERWDVDRLRHELAHSREAGRRIVETVARHRPSGHIVAFTQVSVAPDEPVGQQENTLVLREHRGHGLGLRLKAANSLVLLDVLPSVTMIRTWNADDNAHMLAVNRTLGYVADGYARHWQKILD